MGPRHRCTHRRLRWSLKSARIDAALATFAAMTSPRSGQRAARAPGRRPGRVRDTSPPVGVRQPQVNDSAGTIGRTFALTAGLACRLRPDRRPAVLLVDSTKLQRGGPRSGPASSTLFMRRAARYDVARRRGSNNGSCPDLRARPVPTSFRMGSPPRRSPPIGELSRGEQDRYSPSIHLRAARSIERAASTRRSIPIDLDVPAAWTTAAALATDGLRTKTFRLTRPCSRLPREDG